MINKLGLSVILTASLLGISQISAADCTIYDYADYSGTSRSLSPGERLGSLGHSWDNKVSSVQTTPNCKVTLYADANFKGDTKVLTGQTRYLGSLWDNQTSSAICTCTAPPRPQAAWDNYGGRDGNGWRHHHERNNFAPPPPKHCTLYSDMNFTGIAQPLPANTVHNLLNPQIDDQTSSVKVPQGCTLTVYSRPGLDGRSKIFEEGDSNFVGEMWNDRISSAQCSCR